MSLTDEDKQWLDERLKALGDRLVESMRETQMELLRELRVQTLKDQLRESELKMKRLNRQ
jgi:hypothetical protein